MNDQDIFMGTPGGHHRELMEQILASDESEDKNSIWEKMQGFTAAYWVSKENAGKAYYKEPEGGFYFLANASTVRPEQIAMVQHYFPGEPIYAYNYNSDPGLWKKLAAGVYQIVEVGSTNPEA